MKNTKGILLPLSGAIATGLACALLIGQLTPPAKSKVVVVDLSRLPIPKTIEIPVSGVVLLLAREHANWQVYQDADSAQRLAHSFAATYEDEHGNIVEKRSGTVIPTKRNAIAVFAARASGASLVLVTNPDIVITQAIRVTIKD